MRALVLLTALVVSFSTPPARAEDAATCPAGCVPVAARVRDGFTVAPYLWLPGFSGTVGTGSPDTTTPPIQVEITKYREGLKLAGGMVNVGWRGGRWTAWGDWTYANVRTEAPTISQTLAATMEAQIVGNIAQGFGGYTLLQSGGGRLEAGAGVRGYALTGRLSFEGGSLGETESSGSGVWADAVGAVRGGWSFDDGWELVLDADVGAGGSKLSWEVIGAAGFRFGWGTLFAGWRYLAVDYRSGDFVLDVALSGGFVGARFAL